MKYTLIPIVLLSLLFAAAFVVSPVWAAAVKGYPNVITIDSLKDKYEAVRFDHARHITIAGDCGTCHHEHGMNSALSCKECHDISKEQFKKSLTKTFSACGNCHSSFERTNPGMPSLKVAYHNKCFKCHKGMADVGADPKACAAMCHSKR